MSFRPFKTVRNIFDYYESMKASFARNVKVNIIIGLKARNNGHVKVVNSELLPQWNNNVIFKIKFTSVV